MLHEFLSENRDEIIRRTRARVAERMVLEPSDDGRDYISQFLGQLIETLRFLLSSHDEIGKAAAVHGGDLSRLGFSVGQVIHGYGDVCQIITELAVERNAPITNDEFRLFNRCLDEAMATAVAEYGRQREQSIASQGTERLGHLAHELRNLLNKAMLSYEVIKSGRVGMSGSTSTLLGRSLLELRNLIDRSLAEVRIGSRLQTSEAVNLAELIEEIEIAAALEAKTYQLQLIVPKVDMTVTVEVDRALLSSALSNLLQNAFKFSRAPGHVILRVRTTDKRVFIEVEDSCGGLSAEDPEELFRPFEQKDKDRSGLGLGLAISRQAIEANHGKLVVRNLPGQGCVFTIELPKAGA